MDTISLVKDDQDALNNRVKSIKKDIKSKNILIKDVGNKKPRKITRGKKHFKKPNATIYLGHIPHGFYEDEMMAYFSQFGKVISATLARSKKTGRSRGFGFVEFQNEEVAQIAADTMNNYLMYNRLLKCRYIPPEERKSRCSKIDPKNYPKKLNRIQDLKNKNASTNDLDKTKYQAKVQKKIEQFKKFFEAKGIDFSLKVGDSEMLKVRANSSEGLTTTTKKSPKEPDDQYGILEIDESDDDIHFTTPPNVKKVVRKSCDFSMLNTPSQKKGTKAGQMKETRKKDRIQKNIKNEDIFSGKTSEKSKLGQKMLKTKRSISVALKKKNLTKSIGGISPEKESSAHKSIKSNQKVKKSSSVKSKTK